MNRSSLVRLTMALAVLAALWLPVSGSQAAPAAPTAPTARLRVVHAAPFAGPLDVLVDGAKAFPNVTFKTVTPYDVVAPGSHQIEVVPAGTTTAVITGTLPLAANQDWSLAVTITPTVPASIAPVLLLDDNTQPLTGTVRARFVHLVPLAPNVDIYLKGEPAPVFSNVGFGHASSYATFPAGTYDLEVRPAGAPNTSPPLFTATGITFANQGVYTAWAMGELPSPTAVLSVDRAPVLTHKIYLPILFR